MFAIDLTGLRFGLCTATYRADGLLCAAYRGCMVHDGRGIIMSDPHPQRVLDMRLHEMRLRKQLGGDILQFRDPLLDEAPLRVLVDDLLCGRIHPESVDTGGSSLHLMLRPVNTWLVVDKETRKPKPDGSPMKPQIVTRKAHEHGAHPEVDPPTRVQSAHASIDHGKPGAR